MSSNQTSKMLIAVLIVVVIAASGYFLLYLGEEPDDDPIDIPDIVAVNRPIVIRNDTDFDAQAELYNWTGTGDPGNPYIIKDLSIVNDSVCIFVTNTNRHFVIRNCSLNYTAEPHVNQGAISLHNCTFGRVESCNIDSQGQGVELFLTVECSVWNCTIEANFGLNSTESSEIVFDNNRLYNTFVGVFIVGWSNVEVCNNWITNSDTGIVSQFTYDCAVFNNTISGNKIGIDLDYCTNWSISNNTVIDNEDVGVKLTESSGIVLVRNKIGWNEGGNAVDDGSENAWDDGESQGNFWSDYEGTGEYPIPGSAESIDHFPAVLERPEESRN